MGRQLFHWQDLSALSKTSAITLSIIALIFTIIGILVHQPAIITGVVLLAISAGLIITGRRWGPVVGILITGLMLLVFLFGSSFPLYHLGHPKDAYGTNLPLGLSILSFVIFTAMVTLFWCMNVGLLSGIIATVQNYSKSAHVTPAWFRPALNIALGVWLGAILIGALSQPAIASGNGTTSGEVTVHLGISYFSPNLIAITTGSKFKIVDDGSFTHNLNNGYWLNNRPQPQSQAGAPTVNHIVFDASGKSAEIGPFTAPGTYYIYCSIHPGMTLTIAVQNATPG